jgi:hypothetical protein
VVARKPKSRRAERASGTKARTERSSTQAAVARSNINAEGVRLRITRPSSELRLASSARRDSHHTLAPHSFVRSSSADSSMAGVLFVVCVPTAKHEAELEKHTTAKDEQQLRAASHKFLKSSKKSEFHKSEPHLFGNKQQQAAAAANKVATGQQLAAGSPKLFRAVTESALDSKASQEALNNLFNSTNPHNNLLAPPQSRNNQGKILHS